MEDGRWKVEDGGWKMEDGGWKVEDGGWRMEDGRWRMEDGRWKMEDGGWRMEDGGWKMVKESGKVRFNHPPAAVYEHLARSVLNHALGGKPDDSVIHQRATLRTQYTTRRWYGTVVTTEDATFIPGKAITWRHVDGPLAGSSETFELRPRGDGRATMAHYKGEIRVRHPLLKLIGEYLFAGPEVREVSLGALREASRELDRRAQEDPGE
jgi:hypothetical protein